MSRAIVGAILATMVLVASAHAQCKHQVEVKPDKSVQVTVCGDVPTPAKGDEITITAGATIPAIVATAQKVTTGEFAGRTIVTTEPLTDPELLTEALHALTNAREAFVKIGDTTIDGNVKSEINAKNFTKYDWSVGPATKGDEDGEDDGNGPNVTPLADGDPAGEDDDASAIGALRFRYAGEYARGGFFGQGKNQLLQTTASLLLDTTDQDDTDFIDNNRVAVGVQATGLNFGRLWMHGNAGIEARVERGFHHPNRNADLVAKVSGWVPIARSVTLFPRNGVFIAAPLSFSASYGYRNKKQTGVESQGRVFEATALYHLFLMDQFQIDFSATLTHNDLDDLPAGTPQTQRMYKATMSYMTDPTKGFKVLTSIENGSFGVMLEEVRQYFIGVAFSKLNFAGSGQ